MAEDPFGPEPSIASEIASLQLIPHLILDFGSSFFPRVPKLGKLRQKPARVLTVTHAAVVSKEKRGRVIPPALPRGPKLSRSRVPSVEEILDEVFDFAWENLEVMFDFVDQALIFRDRATMKFPGGSEGSPTLGPGLGAHLSLGERFTGAVQTTHGLRLPQTCPGGRGRHRAPAVGPQNPQGDRIRQERLFDFEASSTAKSWSIRTAIFPTPTLLRSNRSGAGPAG